MLRSALKKLAWPSSPGAFRFFLALVVFVHHCSSFGLGKYAVYVFFVLSGFWVQKMWSLRYSLTISPYLTYATSRAWRLIPSFILVGIIVNLIYFSLSAGLGRVVENNLFHFVLSSIFIFGYNSLDYMSVGPAWSLDIEMQFYLLAPAISYFLLFKGKDGGKYLLFFSGFLAISSASLIEKTSIFNYLFFFSTGMVAAHSLWTPEKTLSYFCIGLVGAGLVVISLSPARGILFGGSTPGPLFIWNPLLNIIAAILTVPFAIFTTSQFSDEEDKMLADLSYIVYLLHWSVFLWMVNIGGSPLRRLPFMIIGWIAVIGASYFIWRYFDKPINRLRAKWVASRAINR